MLTYRLFTIVSLALCWNVQRAQPHFKLQLFSLTLVKDSTWVHSACIVCVYIYMYRCMYLGAQRLHCVCVHLDECIYTCIYV